MVLFDGMDFGEAIVPLATKNLTRHKNISPFLKTQKQVANKNFGRGSLLARGTYWCSSYYLFFQRLKKGGVFGSEGWLGGFFIGFRVDAFETIF